MHTRKREATATIRTVQETRETVEVAIHAHARTRDRMHGAAPTTPPTCAKVCELCVSARARRRIIVQQRVVVEPYLLGVDPGGRPLGDRGEDHGAAGRHWVDRAGVQAAGLLACGNIAEASRLGWSDL